MNSSVQNPRQVALSVCLNVLVKGTSLNEALDSQIDNIESERDKAFCSELCFGFCRYYFVLQGELEKRLKKPLKTRDRDVHIILILGLYQIRFMRVSDHAAVNESVKLLNKTGKGWAKGLVNAVLRSYIRQHMGDGSTDMIHQDDPLSDDEHRSAYPEWMRQRIIEDWKQESERILKAGNVQAPMVLRIDLNQRSREKQLEVLEQNAISAKAHPVIEYAVVLDKAQNVSLLPGFDQGIVSVQDAAAQIAADALDCKTDMKVLDACAAPGGKTLHILQSAKNLRVIALDKDENRLLRVEENLQRAKVKASVLCADAADTEQWFDGELFDRILLDAPCSASGILRRHPDIRLLRKASDISQLAQLQQNILQSLWKVLKPGGQLVYSTCSIFKDENERQIERFVVTQDNCIELPINTVQWGQKRPYGRQILPGFDEMDGFYYACLKKLEPDRIASV